MPPYDDVVVVDPFLRPNPELVVAAARAGALGVLDLTGAGPAGPAALELVAGRVSGGWAVRVPPGAEVDLPAGVGTVIVAGPPVAGQVRAWTGRRVLAEVTSLAEAEAALAAGAHGLVARGCEAGGRAGSTESFVLAQQVAALGRPWWLAGGCAPHTAAVAVAAGAAGVVLSDILALTEEVRPALSTAAALRAMDGTETATVGGYQVWCRPGSAAASRIAALREGAADGAPDVAGLLGCDVDRDLVPAGPDTALAAGMAARWRTVGGVVSALRRAASAQMASAQRVRPLDPGSPLAARHGLRYPVAQGPMTRVSDRAPFAAAVAGAGAVPFLALALLGGPEVRELMERTAEEVGDRPWGVGILGFVPPEVRQAQLEVVHALRPPLALIAGGRPAQARSLEEAGIATFIHVPSPGLLEQFLAQGARRFVFEGRECGGHVGPRTSLALWNAQLEVLERHGDVADVEVLLAGGIHDDVSAAMASTVLAPLAERGAAVGVLMGSAYLFTAEAVAAGAISAAYQRTAVECVETVLLETSPGHATRCVDSPYVRAFTRRKAELTAAGVDPAVMWAELEELNLGRLRMASKGVTRTAEGLVRIDDETATNEGMFMIGQVATLRRETTTVADLHEQVTTGAATRLGARPGPVTVTSRPRRPEPLDVAVIGMAGVFPGSADVESFWADVVSGRDAVTEVPPSRWDAGRYFDPDPAQAGRRTPSRWGGFIPAVGFDALAYGIPPASLAAIEPVQLIALEVATRALADAGYRDRPFDRQRTSVIFGAEGGTDLQGAYNFRNLAAQYLGSLPPELEQFLPALSEDSFPGVLTNVITGRVANRLDLGGLNYTVDAACASSLAALDAACKELVGGGSSMVLCGGADLHNGINDYLMFSAVRALSPTGRSRPFDTASDGIALGEAVACVVLKRRADAERDGDRIYAVIDGVGGSSDGRHLGLTAPRKEGQQLAVQRAYEQAGIGPERIGLVEGHGTGTAVGDRTELATLTEIYSGDGVAPGRSVLGSVKSQVGHTKCAAGLLGLIKVARSLYHGVLPPTLHISEPHGNYDAGTSPFRFLDAAQPWPVADRHGAVSSFGFGGTNFHAVLSAPEGTDRPAWGVGPWPAELLLLRGPSMEGARERAAALAEVAARVAGSDPDGQRHRLRDFAYTVCSGLDRGVGRDQPVQIAVVARDWSDASEKLRGAAGGRADRTGVHLAAGGPGTGGGVAFIYPGQGSQRTGMLADLFVAFPWLQTVLAAGASWVPAMFPPAAHSQEQRAAQAARLTDTTNAQPALGLAGAALTELWHRLGVRADATAGHSYGELPALAAAGAFDLGTLMELSAARAGAMIGAAAALGDDPGTMAAVGMGAAELQEVIAGIDGVVVANHNSRRQSVISGGRDAVAAAIAALDARGVAAKPLNVACAFHSPLVAGGVDRFLQTLAEVPFRAPRLAVMAGSSAAPYPADADAGRRLLAGGIAAPVLWADQVEALYAAGIRTFVEVGPGRVLTHLVGSVLKDRPHLAVASDVPGEHGVVRLLTACAQLATAGVDLDPEVLFAGRADGVEVHRLPLPVPPWTVDGHLVRRADGEVVAGSLPPADQVPAVALSAGPDPAGDPREETVLGFLQSMQAAISAQRDVMMRYLGDTAPAQPDPPAGLPAPPAPTSSAPTPAGPDPEPAPTGGPVDVASVLVRVVSDRTGYPPSMLDPDADLEADLSIDSIKRLEILSEVLQEIGLGATSDDDALIEEVARIKSLGAIAAWMEERGGARMETAAVGPDPAAPSAPASGRAPTCYLLEEVDLGDARRGRPVAGRQVVLAVHRGGPVAARLGPLLEQAGATVATVALGDRPGSLPPGTAEQVAAADTVVYLGALEPGGATDARGSFALWQAAAAGAPRRWVAVSVERDTTDRPAGDDAPTIGWPTGLGGLLKVAALEVAGLDARHVNLEAALLADPGTAARAVLEEIEDDADHVEVDLRAGRRTARILGRPGPQAGAGAGDHRALVPGTEPVVLMTGGARGITAAVARALHRRFGARIELVGRTDLAGDLDPRLAGAADLNSMRRILASEMAVTDPAELDRRARSALAGLEARATVEALTAAGAQVRYHALDVRNRDRLIALVDDIYERHGRIDAVVHGAGILDDRMLVDKDPARFDAVFATKVDPARTLLQCLRPGPVLVVLFASVSGVFGNRGQVDYAAANAALDTLARTYDRVDDKRVIAIDWGPWSGAGMVTDTLAREYERRGVELIDLDAGVQVVLDALADPAPVPAQMVVMAGDPPAGGAGWSEAGRPGEVSAVG